MKTFGEKVRFIVENIDNLVEVANACDKAYCEGTKDAFGPHEPFTAASKPEFVAQNIAGLQAVLTGVSSLAFLDASKPESVLARIANRETANHEEAILLRAANCAWGAGQPFRTDKGPLGRATRVNWFDDLPVDEVAKDLHQIYAAAEWLHEKMKEIE